VNQTEFKAQLEEFWSWVSKRERCASMWWLSLEQYARREFNKAFDKAYYVS
jgi:hypothetical protein